MVEPESLSQLLSPIFDQAAWKKLPLATKGLPASPGAASGQVVFTADDAVEWTREGKKVVLVRKETVPDDIHAVQPIRRGRVADFCGAGGELPDLRTGPGVERDHVRVAHRDEQLVVVERDAAHGDVAAEAMLPDQIAGLAVERLDDAGRVVQINRAVVRQRRRLVGAAFVHRPDPCKLKILGVVARDLIQGAEPGQCCIPAGGWPGTRGRAGDEFRGRRRSTRVPHC